MVQLNPALPNEAIEAAVEELARDRSALSLVGANREIYRLIRNGVKVQVQNARDGGQETNCAQSVRELLR